MRRKFGKILSSLAAKDKKIVLLVGDIGFGIFDDFRKNHPDRFFNLVDSVAVIMHFACATTRYQGSNRVKRMCAPRRKGLGRQPTLLY